MCFLQPTVPRVFTVCVQCNSSICRPSDRTAGWPRAEIWIQDGQSRGRTPTTTTMHTYFKDHHNPLLDHHTSATVIVSCDLKTKIGKRNEREHSHMFFYKRKNSHKDEKFTGHHWNVSYEVKQFSWLYFKKCIFFKPNFLLLILGRWSTGKVV